MAFVRVTGSSSRTKSRASNKGVHTERQALGEESKRDEYSLLSLFPRRRRWEGFDKKTARTTFSSTPNIIILFYFLCILFIYLLFIYLFIFIFFSCVGMFRNVACSGFYRRPGYYRILWMYMYMYMCPNKDRYWPLCAVHSSRN